MAEPSAEEITHLINNTKAGSVVAAAGCGKTEQIARAVYALYVEGAAAQRPLILTHTFAGVDVLRKRLTELGVPSKCYQLDTIASWCLRFAHAYPATSQIQEPNPVTNEDWDELYPVASRLVASKSIDDVLEASYSRVFVDEYQDCNADQHKLILNLNRVLPICIFGDPLQSIFVFAGAIDWEADVAPMFPEIVRLTTPWRWCKEGANTALGARLALIRDSLEVGVSLDFTKDADGISRVYLPIDQGPRTGTIGKQCMETMELEGRLLVIAENRSDAKRASIVKPLAKQKFSALEPLSSKTLLKHAKAIEQATDGARLAKVLDFLRACMGGVTAEFTNGVASKRKGGKAKRGLYGDLIDVGDSVDGPGGFDDVLSLIEGFKSRSDTFTYRRELLAAVVAGLRAVRAEGGSLASAVTEFQTRTRHLGRHIPRRSIGSTLLVKGLEVEHVVIVEDGNMTREDWYVALTRATQSVIILSAKPTIDPSPGRIKGL